MPKRNENIYPVKEKIIPTLVKTVRKISQDHCSRDQDCHYRGKRRGSTPNTAKTAGDLSSTTKVREPVDGKLLRGYMEGRGSPAKLT